jgi:hypothetical protein
MMTSDDGQRRALIKVPTGEALFHEWGLETEEGETGFASFSVAIVEFSDGQVESVPVALIKFID